MGGRFYKPFNDTEEKDVEKYFRPSKLPSIQLTNDTDIEIAQYKKD